MLILKDSSLTLRLSSVLILNVVEGLTTCWEVNENENISDFSGEECGKKRKKND